MPQLVSDPLGIPTAALLDPGECRDVADVLEWLRAQVRTNALADRLELLCAICRQAANGQKMADRRHPSADSDERDAMLDVRQVVEQYGIPERTARRWCAKYGRKVGGRWIVNAIAVEIEVGAEDGKGKLDRGRQGVASRR